MQCQCNGNVRFILSSSGPIVSVKSKLGPEIGSVMAWQPNSLNFALVGNLINQEGRDAAVVVGK